MATGETKLSYLDVVDDIQDGDTVPILRDGKNYMSKGLAQLNADLTDNYRVKTYRTLAQLGLSAPITTAEVYAYMQKNFVGCEAFLSGGTSVISDMPGSNGCLHIYVGNSSSRYGFIEYFQNDGDGGNYYIGHLDSNITTVTWWKLGVTQVSTTSLKELQQEPEDA